MRVVGAVLLLASVPVFLGGTLVERSRETRSAVMQSRERAEQTEGDAHEAGRAAETGSERFFGVDPDSTAAIGAVAAATVAVAALVWSWSAAAVLVLAVLLASAFAAMDVREAIVQTSSSIELAAIAAVLALAHAAAAVAIGSSLRARSASGA